MKHWWPPFLPPTQCTRIPISFCRAQSEQYTLLYIGMQVHCIGGQRRGRDHSIVGLCFWVSSSLPCLCTFYMSISVWNEVFSETFFLSFCSFWGFLNYNFKYNSFQLNIILQTNVFIASDKISLYYSPPNALSHSRWPCLALATNTFCAVDKRVWRWKWTLQCWGQTEHVENVHWNFTHTDTHKHTHTHTHTHAHIFMSALFLTFSCPLVHQYLRCPSVLTVSIGTYSVNEVLQKYSFTYMDMQAHTHTHTHTDSSQRLPNRTYVYIEMIASYFGKWALSPSRDAKGTCTCTDVFGGTKLVLRWSK